MPQAVSRRQYRMMMAILHGDAKDGPRGRPPKSIAAKYTAPSDGAPDSKHKDTGGTWGEKHHAKAKEKVKEARKERKKSKKDLKKAYEDFYKGKGKAAATLVMDNNNRVLLGSHADGLAYPGGHLEPNESKQDGALRELHEETGGCIGRLSTEIFNGTLNGNDVTVYLAEIVSGKPKDSVAGESMKNWKWYEINQIPWDKLRDCCKKPMRDFIDHKLGKSLKGMMALELLEKNVELEKAENPLDIAPNHALKLVGNGVYRKLQAAVEDMTDESFKDIKLDTYTVSIRKHVSNTYSGRVSDGHKVIYQYTNKHLHELAVALMSVFEWYLPEDEDILNIVEDKNLSLDALHGGLGELIDNYKRHNLGNIYQEMETIRETMRNGMAVDLQQIESKIMSLFDKLEDVVHDMAGKHNQLVQSVGKDMDELEMKLRELQSKIDSVDKGPETIEAFSSNPANKDKVHDAFYSYLSKPKIEILPSGKITISFSSDWQDLEKENFLKDMRAKAISKAGKSDA